MKNPKSYSTWHHRRWAVGSGFCSLERELLLVEKLLEADDRNFHGWGYRQFIARKMGLPVERELAFTQKKIEQNFSNYSAWHYRTALLPAMYSSAEEQEQEDAIELDVGALVVEKEEEENAEKQENLDSSALESEINKVEKGEPATTAAATSIERGTPTSASAAVPAEVLDQEFELVKQAFYTEPEDQSGWFYHRWLLGCSLARYQKTVNTASDSNTREEKVDTAGNAATAVAARGALVNTLTTQAEMCKELLDIEPDAKWPLLTYTRLCQLLAELNASHAPHNGSGSGGDGSGDDHSKFDAIEAYTKLQEMDPLRKGFYKDAAQGLANVVALPLRPTPS
jgi:geranylgeranyl transferase type-2 subunit alpha